MLAESIMSVNGFINELSKIFLIVGLVVAAFAALLLSNFISVSISSKTKEIGILRAVGARSLDVFKIFFSESFIITAICVVLSTVGGAFICSVINSEIKSILSEVSLLVFGPLSVGMLIAVALITVVLATYFPVRRAAKRKPVDSIRAL